VCQSVVVTNNPSVLDQNPKFPNDGTHDVFVRLEFTATLNSTQPPQDRPWSRTSAKISGNEVISIDDSDVFHCNKVIDATAMLSVT